MHKQFFLLLTVLLLGCQSEDTVTVREPKLDYYIESYDVRDIGFQPQIKVAYEYNSSGRVSKYSVSSYMPESKSFDELRHFDLIYGDKGVTKILGYLPGKSDPYLEDKYEYLPDGRVSKIEESNAGTGINSEANFVYDATAQSVKVFYTFSNGGSFEYEYQLHNGNIVSDKTTRGSQLCSEGQYAYDDHINPFKNLGYTDYLLTNISSNNKLAEDVNHIGCAFPSFEPETYAYEYNDLGYPTKITTFYKPSVTVVKSQKEIFYK